MAGHTRKAWITIQPRYIQAKGNPAPLTREWMEHTSTLREDLYMCHPTEGEAISIVVQPAYIVDGPLERDYIVVALQGLIAEQAGGSSGMRSDHLKVWIREATP